MHPQMIDVAAAGEASIVLRQPLDTDFDVLADIRRDPAIQDMLMAIPDATDDEAVKSWIERRRNDGAFRIVADATTHEALGFVQISQIHRRDRHGYGGLALLNSARGHGRGPCYRSTAEVAAYCAPKLSDNHRDPGSIG